MTYAELAIVAGIILAAAGLFVAMVGFGFYLGRKTILPYEKQDRAFDPGEAGIHEYDPYATAMTDSRDIKDLK